MRLALSGRMEPREPQTVANGKAAHAKEENQGDNGLQRIASKLTPENVSQFARELPARIEREMKENPYRTLGIAAGVGFGVGTIVGSRLMRTMLLAAGGIVVSELARGRIKEIVDDLLDEEEEIEAREARASEET